jgi:hypothetical protein
MTERRLALHRCAHRRVRLRLSVGATFLQSLRRLRRRLDLIILLHLWVLIPVALLWYLAPRLRLKTSECSATASYGALVTSFKTGLGGSGARGAA